VRCLYRFFERHCARRNAGNPPDPVRRKGQSHWHKRVTARDVVVVREKKSGDLVLVNLFEDTKIERIKNNWEFSRHPRMAVTAMVPGLSVEAEGVGNSKGELDTRRDFFQARRLRY